MAIKERKKFVARELDMIPFVNFMISIIPVLIVSVEFAKISIIDMKLPEGRGSQTKAAVDTPPPEDDMNKLLLTAIITDSVVTLGAKGGFLPSIFYREYHKYSAQDDHTEFTVEYKPGEKVLHPKTSREMTVHERLEIFLYATDEQRNILQCLYTKFGEMVTDVDGNTRTTAKAGDTVYALSNPRRQIIVRDAADLHLAQMSAYDAMRNRLMLVKDRFREAQPDDYADIIIAAENEVLYDKIVQIMDAARMAEFPNISIAKLRS